MTRTNLITGFLGSGKTTSILHLLAQKPADEKWAVLVNEFGEVGIDGALLADSGALLKDPRRLHVLRQWPADAGWAEHPAARGKPDRLLIEPTGLGHPKQILDILTAAVYEPGSICAPRCASSIPASCWMKEPSATTTSAIS